MEDILRKRLGQHPTPLDTDALWAKVEPQLPKKRRQIIPFWVWILGGAILLGGLYFLLSQQPKDELQAVVTPPQVVVDAVPSTLSAPAAAPDTAPDPVTITKPVAAPEIATPFATPATKNPISQRAQPVAPVITETTVVADLSVQETPSVLVRKPTVLAPSLAQSDVEAVSRYNHIAAPLPEISVPAIISAPTGPEIITATIVAPTQSSKEHKYITTPKVEKEETQRLAAIRAEKLRLEDGEANRRIKEREEAAAKADRERQKESARQDWLQTRETGKADRIAEKESARLDTDRRIEAFNAEKDRDKVTQEILKRNKDKYAKADREARLNAVVQRRMRRLQDRLARHEARRAAKADRIAAREARLSSRALAKVKKEKREKKPKQIREKQPAYWTVETGIAFSLPARSVVTAGDNPDEDQVSVNDQYEKALEGISFQVLAGYHRANGLSLRTGFAYSRINSKVENEFTTNGTEPVQAVVAIIESPDGSRREQIGTVQVATETTVKEKYYNSVNSIDIPLLIGYRFGGNKWGLTVEAGPTFNLSSSGNAHLYDGVGNYRTASGEHFRNKLTGLGILANFGGAYNLSEKTMLTVNLRFQHFGKDGFENPSSGYATKYTLIGVQVGYRVRF